MVDTIYCLKYMTAAKMLLIAAREKKGKITDLIVVVGGEENVLVHVRGRMNSNLLENLAEVAGIEELHFTSQI